MKKKNNLYRNKKRWKWLLFFTAIIAFILIIYASNTLLQEIAYEEKKRVEIWADAITAKAELVNYTEDFFENIRKEEGKRAKLLVQALKKANEASLDEDMTFYTDVISSNSTIPTIITNEKGDIDYSVNVDPEIGKMKNIYELGDKLQAYEILKIPYYKQSYNVIYYKESQIYSQLRKVLNELIESFFQEVVINNTSLPVIVTDSTQEKIITYGNIDTSKVVDWKILLKTMKNVNLPIEIELPEQGTCYVFYKESTVLTRLRYFPFIQFIIILIFLVVAYLLFSYARKSEQNQVWVGMSKETAHQLGTPISALLAWNELLKDNNVDETIITEIDKDLHRLETIAQRFSKIGSIPEFQPENIVTVLQDFVLYLQARLSKQIDIKFIIPENPEIIVPINRYLFEWVIENICKNSVDAIDGKGVILLNIIEEEKWVHIDISDTGKGISGQRQKSIFNPGYTSKKRGWGLGLTLAKRIIVEYHKGKLFVLKSLVGKGTTMRISLKKRAN